MTIMILNRDKIMKETLMIERRKKYGKLKLVLEQWNKVVLLVRK